MPPDWTYNTAITFDYNSAQASYPVYFPATVTYSPMPEPEPETALDWLRSQVDELCELARVI